MTYDEAVAWLYATQLHGIRLGLENVHRLLEAMDIQLDGPAYLHVAGTNGKGSVCAMLDAICRADGRRTGLFTSPHLVTFRERIRVDGEMISEAEVAEGLSEMCRVSTGWDHEPTFFELTTVLALRHFQRSGCEVVVFETGMGGRLDATNVVTPAVSVIAPISLDHQLWLGDTVAAIAAEKAGIFKPGVPAVSAPQVDAAAEVLERWAMDIGVAGLALVKEPWSGGPVNLAGRHQLWNAALAVRALAVSGLGIGEETIAQGLREVQWPGRFQQWSDRLILDGAHNPAAAIRLVETWSEVFPEERATLILGVLTDKDLTAICAELLPLAARVFAVPVRSPRSCPAEDVQATIRDMAPDLECTALESLEAALTAAEALPERALICGSLFLVGEALSLLQTQATLQEQSAQ